MTLMDEVSSKAAQKRAKEIAEINVRGRKFNDWETVWVQHRYAESAALFRFTTAERTPPPQIWELLQFKPGDLVQITLGGSQAMNGVIVTRQVGYDASSHAVQLIGKGVTWWVAKSSVDFETGAFDQKSFETIARMVIGKYPISGVETVGVLDPTKFDRVQVNPGEQVWDFLENLARPVGVVLGSNFEGKFLLIGKHAGKVVEELHEGYNILRMQCTITVEDKYSEYMMWNQPPVSDDQSHVEANKMKAEVKGSAPIYSKNITVAEHPVKTQAELESRAKNEADWHEYADIHAAITVQGWHDSSGKLWTPGDDVKIFSPMVMFHGQPLAIMTATFTQDSSSGTLTTLDCVRPGLLKDVIQADLGKPKDPAQPYGNNWGHDDQMGDPRESTDPSQRPASTAPDASVSIGDLEIK